MKPDHSSAAQKRGLIIIADDDRDLAELLAMRLRAAGFAVHTAADSYQALEFARREHPALLLLDVHMPAGDGFSVQRRLGRIEGGDGGGPGGVPVIYLTGDRSPRVSQSARSLGASVLRKPIDHSELLAAVEEAIAGNTARPADAEDAA